LYRDHFERGRGFTTGDLISIINRLTGRDYRAFFQQYVWGTERPPYDSILGYAGLRLERTAQVVGFVGASLREIPAGRFVAIVGPGSPADAAGIVVGDTIVSLNGQPWTPEDVRAWPGKRVSVGVRRNGVTKEFPVTPGTHEEVTYRILDAGTPTAEQLALRASWLRVTSQIEARR
ncbi:MAG TPA: PDZ domain-containing protein, partial [Gemmatimonadaceae bacterium]|nr:PDZ domain-containing protein [Gemmatimonadaceae bacterium]